MHLKGLRLRNFRNGAQIFLEPHPYLNIFVGLNAQGKTNILEAIYFLAFGKSFRLQEYRQLIRKGEQEARVQAWIVRENGEEECQAFLTNQKKIITRNGKRVHTNQFQTMPLVLFSPEEILLLREAPQARREYMDSLISKLSPTYGDKLRNYKKALMQRNKLLKDEGLSKEEKQEQSIPWEVPLRENGISLVTERRGWIQKINEILEGQYRYISNSHQRALFVYEPNVTEESFSNEQERRRMEEIERGLTLVGPHRDGFLPHLEGRPVKVFGSQGEMRSFTLALKLSEMLLFRKLFGEDPILLLDDILSELDWKRNEQFFGRLKEFQGQVFVTATALNLFPATALKNFKTWEIKEGSVFHVS